MEPKLAVFTAVNERRYREAVLSLVFYYLCMMGIEFVIFEQMSVNYSVLLNTFVIHWGKIKTASLFR